MMHPPAIGGMALIFLMLIVTQNHEFVAGQNCGIGGGSGLGQFGRVYSAKFKTSEDCEQQCEYVTGEAEAICKAAEGGACIGESWAAAVTGGAACQAAGGACILKESIYIGNQRKCEEYCDDKFPSKFNKIQENVDLTRQELIKGQTKIQGNVNRTRQVILEGQRDIKSNLEELAKGINTNNKNLADDIKSNLEKLDESITTNNINLADDIKNNLEKLAESITTNNINLVDELILGQGRIIDGVLNSLKESTSEILNSFKQTTSENKQHQKEVLRHLREMSNTSSTLLTSIDNSIDVLEKDLKYNTHISLYGNVFKILDTMDVRYAKVQHDQETGLIVRDFQSDQYVYAVINPNLGMVIGINDIESMLITGNGRNWAMSKSIYEDNPNVFCKQNWFTMFSFKLTRSLFHYRNGRRMKGDPVSATHSEKDYHEKHYEHYSKVCQCNKEDLPTINDRTPICNTYSSNSTVGDKCQVECLGQVLDSVLCEEGGNWTVDPYRLERDEEGKWSCEGCNCNTEGSNGIGCYNTDGSCTCKPNVSGEKCEQCAEGFFGFSNCLSCNCNTEGSNGIECDNTDGSCTCKPNFSGEKCEQCAEGFFGFPNCQSCNCNTEGSKGCDNTDGKCTCKPNIYDKKCEKCLEGFFGFPNCQRGSLIMVATGYSYTDKCQVVDVSSSTSCGNFHSYPYSMDGAAGGVINNTPIICGGYRPSESPRQTESCYSFNENSNSWNLHATMRSRRSGHAASVINDTLFISGGHDDSNNLASTEFIHADGSVTSGPNLPVARREHCMVTLHDSKVIIIGGSPSSLFKNVLVFNPADNSYTNGPSVTYNKYYAACTLFHSALHNGRPVILAAGGWNQATAEVYDYTNSNQWETIGSLPTSDTSNFKGARALPSTTGKGAYLQFNEFLYELRCTTASCTWSVMEQKLTTRVRYSVMMTLPKNFTCPN